MQCLFHMKTLLYLTQLGYFLNHHCTQVNTIGPNNKHMPSNKLKVHVDGSYFAFILN